MTTEQTPFIKNLASSDRKLRTTALGSLRTFLSAHTVASLPPLEILKLWKGLFVAVWMCDRPIPQQNLCAELAGLIEVLPPAAVVPWLRGFWATMAREWTTGIDVHRMNKFLLLVRRMLEASLRWTKAAGGGWDKGRTDDMVELLREWPFAPDEEVPRDSDGDPYIIPAGLRLHVLDIWVDEAEKAGLLEEDDEQAAETVRRIAALIDELENQTTVTAVRIRAKEALEDERLPGNRSKGSGKAGDGAADDEENDGWEGFDD
ncbi:hypothetical protein GQ53DRAFT_683885 [Thozetella sp. PMI_491]|nr:hypothetical protein GQ53DRAFT_683885 [Thozetella sp. PMI_491]